MVARTEFEQRLIEAAWDNHWRFAADINLQGLVTISDIWHITKASFAAPGDFSIFIILLKFPVFSQFFEMSPATVDGWVSVTISIFFWVMVSGLVGLVTGDLP